MGQAENSQRIVAVVGRIEEMEKRVEEMEKRIDGVEKALGIPNSRTSGAPSVGERRSKGQGDEPGLHA